MFYEVDDQKMDEALSPRPLRRDLDRLDAVDVLEADGSLKGMGSDGQDINTATGHSRSPVTRW